MNKKIDRAVINIIVFQSIIMRYEGEIHIRQSPSLFLFGASEGRNTVYQLILAFSSLLNNSPNC